MAQDDLDHIPSIIPAREGGARPGAERRATAGRRHTERTQLAQPVAARSGGVGPFTGLLLLLSLLAAAAACGWAWQLQQKLDAAALQAKSYEQRIGDLESRLSDTDEGMTQNATVQATKLKELDAEVRKLWDNVWKTAKQRLDQLDASNASHDKSIKGLTGSVAKAESTLNSAAADIAKLKSSSDDLARLTASAQARQAEVERLADAINRFDLELAKLTKRVQGNEEWVASINAFRKQVNADLARLQDASRAAQQGP